MNNLLKNILENPYESYMYSYPHKKAYRDFTRHIDLQSLWQKRSNEKLTLYIHIPFCQNKCGYCNLFSTTSLGKEKRAKYVEQMIREMETVRDFLITENGEIRHFDNVILGGGTPTVLEENELEEFLRAIKVILKVDFSKVFFSTESSPRTLSKSKLDLLCEYQLHRVSMGIQSFDQKELKRIGRNEPVDDIEKALKLLFERDISVRNIDLIYGIPEQKIVSFRESLEKTINFAPEEIYLYPLYTREGTGLANYKRNTNMMLSLYEYGRSFLLDNNYLQTSMRSFIRKDKQNSLFPEYSCQENEMIGIGCGARSYRGNVHYSKRYAVKEKNINGIIEEYLAQTDFSRANYGYLMDEDEIKRRYIIKSILKVSGLDIVEYKTRFKTLPMKEFSELQFLINNEFLKQQGEKLYPTERGIMYSDAIGNLFISDIVGQKLTEYREDDIEDLL